MDNDSRGLLFFIFGFTCIWLVFDEFYGKKRISNLTTLLTPNLPSLVKLPNLTPSANNPDWSNQQQAQDNAAKEKKAVNDNKNISQDNKNWFNKMIDSFWTNPIQQNEA